MGLQLHYVAIVDDGTCVDDGTSVRTALSRRLNASDFKLTHPQVRSSNLLRICGPNA